MHAYSSSSTLSSLSVFLTRSNFVVLFYLQITWEHSYFPSLGNLDISMIRTVTTEETISDMNTIVSGDTTVEKCYIVYVVHTHLHT